MPRGSDISEIIRDAVSDYTSNVCSDKPRYIEVKYSLINCFSNSYSIQVFLDESFEFYSISWVLITVRFNQSIGKRFEVIS